MRSRPCFLFAMPALLLAGCVCAPVTDGNTVRLPCCGAFDDSRTVSISTGSAPWRVLRPGTTIPIPVVAASNSDWISPGDSSFSPYVSASWVGPGTEARGDYRYQVVFRVPDCPARDGEPRTTRTITILGSYAADDNAEVRFLDRLLADQSGDAQGWRASAVTGFTYTFSAPAAERSYTLFVNVSNSGGGPTALLLEAVVATRCDLAQG